MARYRTYTVEFKRQLVEEHLGGVSLTELARRHDISRELLRTWARKYEAGELTGDGPAGGAHPRDLRRVPALRLPARDGAAEGGRGTGQPRAGQPDHAGAGPARAAEAALRDHDR